MKIRFKTLDDRRRFVLDIMSGKVHPTPGTKLIVKAVKPRRTVCRAKPPIKVAKPAVAIAHSVGAAVPLSGDDPPDPEPPPQRKTAPGAGRGSRLVTTSKKSGTRARQKKQEPTLQALYQGRELAGYLRGTEALNAAGHCIGKFQNRAPAVAAVLAFSDKEATR